MRAPLSLSIRSAGQSEVKASRICDMFVGQSSLPPEHASVHLMQNVLIQIAAVHASVRSSRDSGDGLHRAPAARMSAIATTCWALALR